MSVLEAAFWVLMSPAVLVVVALAEMALIYLILHVLVSAAN